MAPVSLVLLAEAWTRRAKFLRTEATTAATEARALALVAEASLQRARTPGITTHAAAMLDRKHTRRFKRTTKR